MTALAMIIGMLPMALGLGEGGEQNAPLGRAVIGGLLVATVATLSSCRWCTAGCAARRRATATARSRTHTGSTPTTAITAATPPPTTAHSRPDMTEETLALPAPEERKLLPAPKDSRRDDGDPRRRRRILLFAAIALLVLAAVGWFFHHREATQAKEANDAARNRLPTVGTIDVSPSPAVADLRLPGTIAALTEASLFARASGYLKARYVDIGDPVRRGQVLAEIDAPDLDRRLVMARQPASRHARPSTTQRRGSTSHASLTTASSSWSRMTRSRSSRSTRRSRTSTPRRPASR